MRVLVVGTTADYIAVISARYPGRALFLTDERERIRSAETAPGSSDEVLCDLGAPDDAVRRLAVHLETHDIALEGVTAFDCESLSLAAEIARRWRLAFPSQQSVENCRSKHISKQLWQEADVNCSQSRIIATVEEAIAFMRETGRPAIMKPLTGSGSELVFLCRDKLECIASFKMLTAGLTERRSTRMHNDPLRRAAGDSAATRFAIEEFIEGREYSCDFILENGEVEIVRIAKKIPAVGHPIGTTLAYVVPANLPGAIDMVRFRSQIADACHAVGLTRALCMLDFIIRDDKAEFLELTPRPGGDCLPSLIQHSMDIDMFGLTLDFAAGRRLSLPAARNRTPLVGLRIISRQAGIFKGIDSPAIENDSRVVEVFQKHQSGHRIVLPPADYDSRILGHVIFRPVSKNDLEAECKSLEAKLAIRLEQASCPTNAA
jgi:biotin carboxylase